MGGMVLETNMTEIFTRIDEQNKLERQEVSRPSYHSRYTFDLNFCPYHRPASPPLPLGPSPLSRI